MTRLEMGELYATQAGVLARRFIGGVLYMSRQIIEGGYPTPTAAQTSWANAVDVAGDVTLFANTVVKWGRAAQRHYASNWQRNHRW